MKNLLFLLLVFVAQITFAQNVTIEGSIKITEGAQAGYVLKSDANGVGIWSPQENAVRKQIFVTDFGAKGDGTTDDTNAFQTAIDSAAIQGGTLHIPAGDYKITQTLTVPEGVSLRGYGLGSRIDNTANSSKGSQLSFYGNNQFALVFSGDYLGCSNLAIVDAGGQAAGGINFLATAGKFGIGGTFNDLLLLNFTNGTGLKLTASSTSGIAWSSFENIHICNAKKGIHLAIADDGSFINLVTFRSIDISGSGFDYGLHIEGPLSTTDWYGVSMKSDCPNVGHIILDTKGYVNIYGIQIESPGNACTDEVILVQLNADSRGSYIHGTAGKGRIEDYGSNFIDLQGDSDVGVRPSGNNLLQNAAFKGVVNNTIPYWEFKTGYDTPDALEVQTAEWQENHNVLKLTIGAGKSVRLGQKTTYFSKAYNNKDCLFGAMVKTTAPNVKVFPYYQTCGGIGSSIGSAHPNDDKWHYLGKTSDVDPTANCQPNPQFIFDNSAGGSAAIVYITTPSFVFNRGEKPTLEAGTITSAGGILTGTLSTSMLTVASPSGNDLQVAADANLFQISGTNSIKSINNSTAIFPKGTMITLLFESSGLQVTHDVAKLKLLGGANYISEAFSSLKFVSLGDGIWQEVDRNCLNGCKPAAVNKEAQTSSNIQLTTEENLVLIQPKTTQSLPDNVINIYPNPTKYGINVAFNHWERGKNYQLQLLDNSGRILLKKSLDSPTNWVDFGQMNTVAGMYQVQILDNKTVVYNRGLVVVKE